MNADALTGTYLDRIVADVRRRLGELGKEVVEASERPERARRSLVDSIGAARACGELAVIGEVKRRSPSVGTIADGMDPASQARSYAAAGAAGISVLTEVDHFGGSIADLVAVQRSVDVPVLRKDFVIDERQLEGASRAGADAVLLIAALHDDRGLEHLVERAHALGLEVLLEVHDEREMRRALATGADAIGINNRDLRSFVVDLAVTECLVPLAAGDGRPVVAESGVRTGGDAARMRAAGVDALLVGEALMRAPRAGALLRRLATATEGEEATS